MVNRTKDGRVLNWRPSHPLGGDREQLGARYKNTATPYPDSIDLRETDSPIFDQGKEGSCTGNASAGLADFLEIKRGLSADPKTNPQEYVKGKFVPASRNFVYWVERSYNGETKEDSGAYIHDSAKVFLEKGACSELTLPYSTQTLFPQPPPAAWGEAFHHKVKSTQQLNVTSHSIADLLDCLSQGYPFIFGVVLYQEFEKIGSDGIVPMPGWFERPIGGHALCAVGYSIEKQSFIVRNSWGTDWGDKGYCYFPFRYIINQNLASDFWTFR